MKMILKITAGVCAGILAALALINAPAWFEKARQQSLEDDARSVIWNTTPDVAITKCGKPFYDGPSTLMTGEEYADIYRDLRFDAVPSYYGGLILEFYRTNKADEWHLMSARETPSNEDIQKENDKGFSMYGVGEPIKGDSAATNKEILSRLPCLNRVDASTTLQSNERAANGSHNKASSGSEAQPPVSLPPAPIYELTKDEVISHHDWTAKNISILGVKIGDAARDVANNLGKLENSRTLPKEYLTVYQNTGIFIFSLKDTGKVHSMEVTELFAKRITDKKLKTLLGGDLKYMRELLGPEETVDANPDDNSTAYVYDAKGFRVVQYKVNGKMLTSLRFSELRK